MRDEPLAEHQTTPLLARLGLTAEELTAIRRQGFVARERHRGQLVFKLRFRMPPAGKQQVRYLGSDTAMAEAVRRELVQIQQPRDLDLQLGKLKQQIGQKLRSDKAKLAVRLEQAGYHFHGLAVRRKRIAK
jgi:hypothetical protein